MCQESSTLDPRAPVVITYTIDRAELARRGRLGGRATAARHDAVQQTEPARRTFLSQFKTARERSDHFAELGRRSAVVRKARKEALMGEEVANAPLAA